MRRFWIGLGIVVALVGGVLLYLWLRPLPVQVAVVKKGLAEQRVYGSARVEARKRASIKSRVSGTVLSVPIEVGQIVKEGQLLLSIDTPQIREDVTRAQADFYAAQQRFREKPQLAALKSAAQSIRSELDQAKADLNRTKALAAQSAATPSDLERAQTRVTMLASQLAANISQQRESEITMQAELSRQKASVGSLRSRIDDMELRAPISGTLLWQGPKLGDVVLVNQEIARVADTSHLWVEALVDEADIPNVREGMYAWIRLNGDGDRMFKAKVARIIPEVQMETKSVEVDLEFLEQKNPAEMGMVSGMTGEAYIISKSKQDAFLIPSYALDLKSVWVEEKGVFKKKKGAKWNAAAQDRRIGVWVVEKGHLKERPVQIGVQGAEFVEVISGLETGDHVAIPEEGKPFKEGQSVKEKSTDGAEGK